VNVPQLSPVGHEAGHLVVHVVLSVLHVELAGQVPQVTNPPQPSGIVPQTSPAGHALSGVQPQTFATLGVPPPHVLVPEHVPQFSVPPQPSLIVPQLSGEGQPVALVQPQTLAIPGFPAPQVWPVGHVPQLTAGQPGAVKVPQLSPAGHVVWHLGEQVFPSVLQESPVGQLPQVIVPPQPSDAVPQICPAGQAVSGVQPQTLALPGFPPPQVWPAGQVGPQVTVPPQVSGIVPQLSGAGHALSGAQTSGEASGAPASAGHSMLISAPSKKVRAFSLQSSSPHSRPS
jgi:hypothetical protein